MIGPGDLGEYQGPPGPPGEIDHFFQVFVRVEKRAECPHGWGTTTSDPNGVRIMCPEGRDCWLVKWEWAD
jgi:hypothetical protein